VVVRRRSPVLVALVAAVALVAGCESGPASSSPVPIMPTPPAMGTECATLPTAAPGSELASFAPARDAELEARFPTQVDGQPVTNVQSGRLIETLCLIGGQSGVDRLRTQAPSNIDVMNLVIGSAEATVDGEQVRLTAFRVPGRDGGELLRDVADLARSVGGSEPKFAGELTPAMVGGKNVTSWTSTDGETSYLYVSGDALIIVDAATPSQADKIFSVIP
jgi:hypothetical protein